MLTRDRRYGFRIPLEIFLNQYIKDKPFRSLTTNLSETGLYLNRVAPPSSPLKAGPVALEFELPGTQEIIWARGEICYETGEDGYVRGCGIRFTGIPGAHARLVRDYCVEARRSHLDQLLNRIRRPGRAQA